MSKNTFTLPITNVRTAIKCARRFKRPQENWRCLYRSIRVQQYMYSDASTSVTSARRHNNHKSRVISLICVVSVWVFSDVWARMFENIIPLNCDATHFRTSHIKVHRQCFEQPWWHHIRDQTKQTTSQHWGNALMYYWSLACRLIWQMRGVINKIHHAVINLWLNCIVMNQSTDSNKYWIETKP